MIDIDSAARAIFMAMYSLLDGNAERVYIYVKATPIFLEDNPFLAADVHMPPGATAGHVVLSIGSTAVRNLTIEDRILYFDTRHGGQPFSCKVYLGDIIGMADPDTDNSTIYDVSLVPIVSPEGGSVACRPLGSMEMAAFTAPAPEAKETKPGLRVVK